MSESSPVGTPGIMSVAGLLVSMKNTTGGVPSPAAAAAAGLQDTQLLYDEDLFSGPTPMKSEREGGLGTLVFPGGIQREFPWCFSLRRMLGITVWDE
jgi:hypothetical protein